MRYAEAVTGGDAAASPSVGKTLFVWFCAFVGWCGVTAAGFADGHMLVSDPIVASVAVISLVWFLVATFAGLRGLFARREPVAISHRRWPRGTLVMVVFASLGGLLVTLLLYFVRVKAGDPITPQPLTRGFETTAFAAVVISAVRALRAPSIRRLAMVTVAGALAWPLLLLVHGITSGPASSREHSGTCQVLAAAMNLCGLVAMIFARLLSEEPAGPKAPPRAVATVHHD